jgi:predicted metal-dependent phosphoesterase TrpH
MVASMNAIDLHVHTTASDGTMSPVEIVSYAKKKGLRAIAITDHDTIEGVDEALQEGSKSGFEVIPGVELSVDAPSGTMHVLGYFIDHTQPALKDKLRLLQEVRGERNIKMVEKLAALGITIELSEVKAAPEHGQIGRPHFAYTMVQKGYARTIQDAFDRYLGKGRPAYVEKFRFSPREAMQFITKAGGITVLAHPFTLNKAKPADFEVVVRDLKEKGLDGIEVYYPEHSDGQKTLYRDMAKKYGLVISAGSDFHGLNKDEPDLGEGYGGKEVTYGLLEAMRARRESKLNT